MYYIGIDIGETPQKTMYAILNDKSELISTGALNNVKEFGDIPSQIDSVLINIGDDRILMQNEVWVDTIGFGAGIYLHLKESAKYKDITHGVKIGIEKNGPTYDQLYRAFVDSVGHMDEFRGMPSTDPNREYRVLMIAFYGYLSGLDLFDKNDHLNLKKA